MALALATPLSSASPAPAVIVPPSPEAYSDYLSHAIIWHDPGPLTAADLRNGPAAPLPNAIAQARTGQPLECHFETRGQDMGGRTRKFLCKALDGQSLRIKYFDHGTTPTARCLRKSPRRGCCGRSASTPTPSFR
jgi:hypothetical protein